MSLSRPLTCGHSPGGKPGGLFARQVEAVRHSGEHPVPGTSASAAATSTSAPPGPTATAAASSGIVVSKFLCATRLGN